MKSQSRYDDPEYRNQVAKQMLGTPTLEIACRAITDLRAERKHDAIYIDDLLKRIADLEAVAVKKHEDTVYGTEIIERFLRSMEELQRQQTEDIHYIREWKRLIESGEVTVSNIKEYKQK